MAVCEYSYYFCHNLYYYIIPFLAQFTYYYIYPCSRLLYYHSLRYIYVLYVYAYAYVCVMLVIKFGSYSYSRFFIPAFIFVCDFSNSLIKIIWFTIFTSLFFFPFLVFVIKKKKKNSHC